MKYAHILNAFFGSVWAILPEKWHEIAGFLSAKSAGEDLAERGEELRRDRGSRLQSLRKAAQAVVPRAATRIDGTIIAGKTAIVPVLGVICQRLGMMERMSGGVSTEELGATLDSLAADKMVKQVLLVIDSPGGSVHGVPELAKKIRGIRAKKRTVAIADSCAASAAVWLAAQCSDFAVTPGGLVGCIGVIAAHFDYSEQNKMMGVKPTLVYSSRYKAEGSPEIPLSEEARQEWQAKVMHYHAMFIADVASGRGVPEKRVEERFGQGRMLTPEAAKDAGLVDRVATFEKVLRTLEGDSATAGPIGTAQETKIMAKAKGPRAELKEGDKVTVTEGNRHGEAHTGRTGIVRQISTPAIAIEFDDEPGVLVGENGWWTEAELQVEAAAQPEEQPAEEAPPAAPPAPPAGKRAKAQAAAKARLAELE